MKTNEKFIFTEWYRMMPFPDAISWCHFLMPFHFTMLRAVVAAGFEVWALITVIIGPKKVWFIIGIELIGLQFDVKSYCETLKSNTASPWFEITSMFSDQNCMTWSPSSAWLYPFWNPKIQLLINRFFVSVYKYFIDPVEWGFEESCRSCRSFSRNFIGFFKKSLKIWLVVVF